MSEGFRNLKRLLASLCIVTTLAGLLNGLLLSPSLSQETDGTKKSVGEFHNVNKPDTRLIAGIADSERANCDLISGDFNIVKNGVTLKLGEPASAQVVTTILASSTSREQRSWVIQVPNCAVEILVKIGVRTDNGWRIVPLQGTLPIND